jgi:hypothetical protein
MTTLAVAMIAGCVSGSHACSTPLPNCGVLAVHFAGLDQAWDVSTHACPPRAHQGALVAI